MNRIQEMVKDNKRNWLLVETLTGNLNELHGDNYSPEYYFGDGNISEEEIYDCIDRDLISIRELDIIYQGFRPWEVENRKYSCKRLLQEYKGLVKVKENKKKREKVIQILKEKGLLYMIRVVPKN